MPWNLACFVKHRKHLSIIFILPYSIIFLILGSSNIRQVVKTCATTIVCPIKPTVLDIACRGEDIIIVDSFEHIELEEEFQ